MASEIINSMLEAMEHARLNLRRDENVAPYLKPIIRWKPVPIETFKLFVSQVEDTTLFYQRRRIIIFTIFKN